MALPNYVKFQRGSLSAYTKLAVKDENTLYFIFDPIDQSKGSLYLGDKLISSNVGGSGVSSLAELTDVVVTGAQTGDFLVKSSSGTWAATSASAVAALIVEAGGLTADLDIDENVFQFNEVNGQLELKGFTAASTGMIPVKSNEGLLSWQAAPVDLSSRVESLETSMGTVQTDLQSIDGRITSAVNAAISNSGHLTYQVVENLSDATAANTIYLHAKSDSASNDLFEEFMVVNGSLEKIGNFGINLSGFATTSAVSALESRVGTLETNSVTSATFATVTSSLNTRVEALETSVGSFVTSATFASVVGNFSILSSYTSATNVTESIKDIYDRLVWVELVDTE